VLRRNFGLTKERDGTQRTKTNDELDELIRHKNKINYIKAQRLTIQSLVVSLRTTRLNIKKILHGARFALSVLKGSQNRQRPLVYTSLTDWFL